MVASKMIEVEMPNQYSSKAEWSAVIGQCLAELMFLFIYHVL